ncbi:MAG: chromate efflux transporter [Candidatus Rokubacteria bacterium]|nr:chromate efflux transporter [Candidatus Rokubacteria bacterium]
MAGAPRRLPGVPPGSRLLEVAAVFLKLGTVGFGGPAAHVALMRDEVVRRRRWVSDERFLDLLGMTNLIPGPNSTEMAIHLGYQRAGWPGLVVGGACFVVPAMLIVLACAWLYGRWGATPQASWLLYGVKPVIIAVVVQAVWSLFRAAVKGPLLVAVGAGVVALHMLGAGEIVLLLGAGALVVLLRAGRRLSGAIVLCATATAPAASLAQVSVAAGSAAIGTLFLVFLKIGAVLYGSGYVLLAFLRSDFVNRLGWLSDQQLLDAVAVGQFTPGPVLTTATFVGYLVGGAAGALLATLAIFLPSFVFVALSGPLLPRVRGSRWSGAFLDGVNVASLGLMAAVTWELGRAALVDGLTIALAVGAAVLLVWLRVNSAWLVLAGAAIGGASTLLGR